MKVTLNRILLIFFCLLISSCARIDLPERKTTINKLPPLSSSYTRVYFLPGTVHLKGGILYHPDPIKMKEGGDVFINDIYIGYFYRDEIIAVDLPLGRYRIKWVTKLGEFDVSHTKSIIYELNTNKSETICFVAHKDQNGSNSLFGAIGALADSELFVSYFVLKDNNIEELLKNKKIITYKVLNNTNIK